MLEVFAKSLFKLFLNTVAQPSFLENEFEFVKGIRNIQAMSAGYINLIRLT